MTRGRSLGFLAAQQKTSYVIRSGHKIKVKQLLKERNTSIPGAEIHLKPQEPS